MKAKVGQLRMHTREPSGGGSSNEGKGKKREGRKGKKREEKGRKEKGRKEKGKGRKREEKGRREGEGVSILHTAAHRQKRNEKRQQNVQ